MKGILTLPLPQRLRTILVDSGTTTKRSAQYARIWLGSGLLVSIAVCILAVYISFGRFMPASITLLSIILSLPLCVMGIKAVL